MKSDENDPALEELRTISALSNARYYVHGDHFVWGGRLYSKRDGYVKVFNSICYQFAGRTLSGITDEYWKLKYIPPDTLKSVKGREMFNMFFPLEDNDSLSK